MKVTVTTLTDDIFVLDVSEDLELENFKAFCEVESGYPASETVIAFNGRPLLDNSKSLKDLGIKDGDCVILQHMLHSGSQAHGAGNGCAGVRVAGPLTCAFLCFQSRLSILAASRCPGRRAPPETPNGRAPLVTASSKTTPL